MTAVSTPLGTATAHKRATITPSRLATDVWLLAERNLKIWRRPRSSSPRSCSRSCTLILLVFVFGAIANLGRHRPHLQGLRRARGPRADDGVRRASSRASIADDMHTGMIDRFRSLPGRALWVLARPHRG